MFAHNAEASLSPALVIVRRIIHFDCIKASRLLLLSWKMELRIFNYDVQPLVK
jgi:hypothetical protein